MLVGVFTSEQKRLFVLEYMDQPHGQKAKWLQAQAFSRSVFRGWRLAYLGGDLDRGLTPRNAELVTSSGHRMIQLEKAFDRQTAELVKLRGQNEQLQATNTALGKAIGFMHERSEHMPGNTPTPSEPKN